jgi:hypothetical protein
MLVFSKNFKKHLKIVFKFFKNDHGHRFLICLNEHAHSLRMAFGNYPFTGNAKLDTLMDFFMNSHPIIFCLKV